MDSTTEYAKKIVSGKILASQSIMDACNRHLKDMESQTEYVWDFSYAEKAISFMEMLPDPKTGKTFPLASFQKFIVGSIYGWRRADNKELRRFKKAVVSVARKNGKSLLISGIILYEFLFGQNPAMSRQLFTGANDKAQASIIFNMCAKQLEALRSHYPEIRKATKKVRDELRNLTDYSYVRPLSRETGGLDGYEMYCCAVDEYAAAKTDELMELIESSQGQLESPLTFIISTAGFNLNGPFHTIEWNYAKKVANGKVINDTYFSFIAEQESEDEIRNESTWIKSNPILEVESIQGQLYDYLRKRLTEATEKGNLNGVLVKNFNMWRQSSEESYIDKTTWELARIDKPDTHKRRVWLGVDVGRVSDLFAITPVIMMDDFWYIDSFSFVATKYGLTAKEKRDGVSYSNLERQGYCEITTLESGVIDDERVLEKIEEMVYSNDWEVNGICFDPYQFGTLLTMIEKRHPEWPLIEVSQTTMVLNMPTKQFRDDLKNGKIKHSGNPLLTMAVNNAYIKTDNNGMRIDKNKNSNKIDPLDAALDGYAVCYLEPFDGSGYWTSEKILGGETLF